MEPAVPHEVLHWEPERIRRDGTALTWLVHAAVDAPESQRPPVLEKLLQVVERPVNKEVCQALGVPLVTLLSRADTASRYVGARLLRHAGEVPAARALLIRGLGADEVKVREACLEALWNFHLRAEELVPALRSERPEERAAAMRRVNPALHEPLEAEFKRLLGDPVASLRHQAALWRKDDARDERQWEVLLEVARAGEESSREEALHRLWTWGPREESLRQLRELLKTDPDPSPRVSAARALQHLAPSRPEVAQALLEALRDVSPDVGREAAALMRHSIPAGAVIPGLRAALEDPGLSEKVRGQAALTLGRLGTGEVVPLLARLLEQPDESFAAGRDEVTGLRSESRPMKGDLARALEALGPLAREAVPSLLRSMRGDRGMHQWDAAEAVQRLGMAREELEAALCEVLPGTRGMLRKRLREVLSRLEPASGGALRELVLALVDDAEAYEEVPPALGLWRAVDARPEHLARLEAFTREEDPRMRDAATQALELLGHPTAEGLEALARRLLSDEDSERQDVVRTLRVLGRRARGVLPKVLEWLPRVSPEARAAVLSVVGPLSGGTWDEDSRAALATGMKDTEARVREAAVWALGDFTPRDEELARAASTLSADAEPGVREAVAVTLRTRAREPRAVEPVVRALGQFAFVLYTALREGDGNRLCSPLSVFTLLAMVLRGTRGLTEQAVQRVLHWPAEPADLSTVLRGFSDKLHVVAAQPGGSAEEGFTLVSANGFWFQEDYPVLRHYQQELAEAFGVTPTQVDFARAPEQTSQLINAWAHERTQGRIPAIVAATGQPPNTRFVLANTVFLRARWEQPFEEVTREEPFRLLEGQVVEVPMMRREGTFGYARGAGYQLIELPYRGRQVSMVLLLPDTGFFERFERLLDGERLEELLAELAPRSDMRLRMPRLHLDLSIDLTRLAERLGLSALFSPGADLSGMSPERAAFQGRLLHIVTLTVDEKGTEAAAATVLSHIGGVPQEVEVNRPFLFLLRHEETGAVLFFGRVMDPRAPSC